MHDERERCTVAVAMKVRPSEIAVIDRGARRRRMSRTAFLVATALAAEAAAARREEAAEARHAARLRQEGA